MTQEQELALAEQCGATHEIDPRRGGQWCKFKLGTWSVWECAHQGRVRWATANLVDDHFADHDYHDTLGEAFERVKQQSKPTTGPQSFKVYKCSKCGHETEIQTNHWGECYGLGVHNGNNNCPGCPPIDRPTVWVCQEEPPETHGVAAPWTVATVEIKD